MQRTGFSAAAQFVCCCFFFVFLYIWVFFVLVFFFQIPTVKNIQSLINDVVIYLRVSIRDGNNKLDLTPTCKVKGKDSLLFAIISREKLKRFYSNFVGNSLVELHIFLGGWGVLCASQGNLEKQQ